MSATPYFIRDWKIKLNTKASGEVTLSNALYGDEALRATFTIEQRAMQSYWFGDIAVYNSSDAMKTVIQKGDTVTVDAGYQNPGPRNIFQGKVWQPLWERENATDLRLTLHCFVGLFEDEYGYSSCTIAAGATQAQAVRQVAANAATKINVASLDPALDQKTYPRGFTYAGPARKFFNDVAIDNNLNVWIGGDGVSIRSLSPQGTTPDVVYSPPLSGSGAVSTSVGQTKRILIGTPQQTQEGVQFRTLLDSDLSLGKLVKLDMVVANKLASVPGQLPALVDKDGLYVVAGIRHTGDTRGNEWYSDVVAVTREYSKLAGVIMR